MDKVLEWEYGHAGSLNTVNLWNNNVEVWACQEWGISFIPNFNQYGKGQSKHDP